MKNFQRFGGGVIPSARNYPIAYNTAIKAGALVKISAGLVALVGDSETGEILGIAAENHPGTADALNPRANGTEILVYDCDDLVMSSPAPVFEATGGSTTTVTTDELGAFSNDDLNHGFLKLVEKAAGSTNTDEIGTIKEITDYAYNSTGTVSTFTVATGATAVDGDKYALFFPVGLKKMTSNSDRTSLKATGVGTTTLTAVGCDAEAGLVFVKANKHF